MTAKIVDNFGIENSNMLSYNNLYINEKAACSDLSEDKAIGTYINMAHLQNSP